MRNESKKVELGLHAVLKLGRNVEERRSSLLGDLEGEL